MSLSSVPHVVHVTGARPNFPKAAPVIRALDALGIRQVLVHTGQHYDPVMSEVFFQQLGLPEPDVNLGVGSGSHAHQTAKVMTELEDMFIAERPDLVVVYGDVNSTVAASLVAAKLHIPVAHVEAGLRSFDRTMPEEVNRIVTDSLADLLFTTSPDANVHLGAEGVAADKIHFVGNPMIDTLLANLDKFDAEVAREHLGLEGDYIVATLHRPANVDDPAQAAAIVKVLHEVADRTSVVIPLHPRGRAAFEAAGLMDHDSVKVIEPLGYVEFMGLVRGSLAVITDSGGVQEETTMLGIPCLTLRPNTERPVTITHGTNQLVTQHDLLASLEPVIDGTRTSNGVTPPLWDGHAGDRIAAVISAALTSQTA
ncbi:UDP-N-acetyl glucosamine 2-epimerase [Aeromicrobium sp. Root236]|uniref:non-hydrolyzing UDP-N-acetylglucosamine 2-epimerase n=1 Tax=Aeromicrobium sp. Root236 TaxID=1736498 RepID=UPI0006FECB38|nr:UDP-N-acetylglucosamine 2-epimerase (non-hydrolyzing) [Aeromicrobium sp. Root236]KRC65965.1 UDP-N-acetyl glucosamine 2-epimerase [Aeromicrobium sp. Root236]